MDLLAMERMGDKMDHWNGHGTVITARTAGLLVHLGGVRLFRRRMTRLEGVLRVISAGSGGAVVKVVAIWRSFFEAIRRTACNSGRFQREVIWRSQVETTTDGLL
jgi:hypothetical protein